MASKNLADAVAALKAARLEEERLTAAAREARKAADDLDQQRKTAVTAREDAKRTVDWMVERDTAPPSKGIL
jgi:hypothetical protein